MISSTAAPIAETPAPTTVSAPAHATDTQPAQVIAQRSSTERRIVVWVTAITVACCTLAIIGSLCWVVVRDGNSALVSDVTTKLTFIAAIAILSMLAALFGQNQQLGKLIDKLS